MYTIAIAGQLQKTDVFTTSTQCPSRPDKQTRYRSKLMNFNHSTIDAATWA